MKSILYFFLISGQLGWTGGLGEKEGETWESIFEKLHDGVSGVAKS